MLRDLHDVQIVQGLNRSRIWSNVRRLSESGQSRRVRTFHVMDISKGSTRVSGGLHFGSVATLPVQFRVRASFTVKGLKACLDC